MSPHKNIPSSATVVNMTGSNTPATSRIVNNRGRRSLPPGVYVPTVAFFDPVTEDLDLDTTASHAIRLAQAGVAGITTQGSNGEAVHLSHQERKQITATTREALDAAGFPTVPVMVGCGAQSTREAIQLCQDAYDAGGDYALVLPPAYYQGLFNQDSVKSFFIDVATASPIPILIYNYPGAVSGLDLSSDVIIALAEHPNIVGCKLTCGNTGKLQRITAATRSSTLSKPGTGFLCMGGSADFMLQTLIAGGSGVIGGLGNVAPKAMVRIMQLYASGLIEEAQTLQEVVARGDWAAIRGGIVGTKSALMSFFGYGGYARKPLPKPSKDESKVWREAFDEMVQVEKSL